MIRNWYNWIPHPTPDASRERYKKDEQYQSELPTIETLPWNEQYKINGGVCVWGGGGLKPMYTTLPLRICMNLYATRIFPSDT